MNENGIDGQVATQLPEGAEQTEQPAQPTKRPAPPTEFTDEWCYEVWNLNARNNGTVKYRRYDTTGTGRDFKWGNEVGEVVSRTRGGPGLAYSRHASSTMYASLPVGTIKETIIVQYRHGQKCGSEREYYVLVAEWDDQKKEYDWNWREIDLDELNKKG